MSKTEEALTETHNRSAKVVGGLSLAISRRSFRRATALYWITELRHAADILEKLVAGQEQKDKS